jgi:C1A family cysteine protease
MPTNQVPRLGWFRDPPKLPGQRPDLDAEELLSAKIRVPPPFASNRHLILTVLDQGQLGSCVANAITQAVRASHVRQGVEHPRIASRLFGYYLSRAYHHATQIDDGTYLRTYFQALDKFGFCPETAWPYDVSRFADMPSGAAFRAGFDQHSPTIYRRISTAGATRSDDIKRALAAGYLVCFGTLVSEEFLGLNNYHAVEAPIGKSIAGGHALCAVGYDGDVFEICNSWGFEWNDGGYCWFDRSYMEWEETTDLWIVEQSPRYSE